MDTEVFVPRHAAPARGAGAGSSLPFDRLMLMARSGEATTNHIRAVGAGRVVDRQVPAGSPGIAVVSRSGQTVYANQQLCTFLGVSAAELMATPFPDFVVGSKPGALSAGGSGLWVFRRIDGGEVPAVVSVVSVCDESGETVRVVVSVSGLDSPVPYEGPHAASSTDFDGYEPSHLERQIADALDEARADEKLVGVLRIDMDGFHLLRERHGETAAAAISRTLVQRICETLPLDATVGQFTSGEFGVLVVGGTPEGLMEIGAELLREIAKPMLVGDVELLLTVSIGMSIAEPTSTTDSLVAEAGEALQRARRRGGDRLERFDDAMRSRAREGAAFADHLRSAIARKQIDVVYQPIVTVEGRLTGVEALVRWTHPTRGQIAPSYLVGVAEETGLIHDLGRLVLERACADVARWRIERPELTVSVNLSGLELVRTNIVAEVERTLAAHSLDPQALTLEITESVLMEDPGAATASCAQLRSRGIRIVVDDFGTGYSSLIYLRRFPLQGLKLDRLFIADIETDPQSREIVGFVVQLAHALKLLVVAEGVESFAQVQVLHELGCDLIQGYYWSRPVPAEGIDAIVNSGGVVAASAIVEPVRLPQEAPVQVAAPALVGARHRVLLIDDSAGQRNLTRLALEESGRYVVIAEAESADAGVGLARQYRPDLIMLDLAMPGRNGLEVIPELLAASAGAEVVVSSGYISNGSAAQARSVGAAACLDKYLPPDALIAQLDSVM